MIARRPPRLRARGRRAGPASVRWVSADTVLGLLLAGALIALAFTTTGGSHLGPNTWSEILIVLIAAALAITVAAVGRSRDRCGGRAHWPPSVGWSR